MGECWDVSDGANSVPREWCELVNDADVSYTQDIA